MRLIEIDQFTGWERDITWLEQPRATKEQFEKSANWRRKNISSRYEYKIVDDNYLVNGMAGGQL